MTVLKAKLTHWLHWPKLDIIRPALKPLYQPSLAIRYIFTFSILALATAIRWSFDAELGDTQAYTFYFAAIAITSWYAGFWPSVVAIVLAYFSAHWFFIHPRYELAFHEYTLDDYISLGGFLFSGLAISFTSRALHTARKRAEAKQQELAREAIERERAQLELQKTQSQLQEHAHMLEQRVEERTANLVQTIHSLEGVCYHIAHDLRAPLRAVQGFTTLLLEEYAPKLDKAGEDYARRAADSANRMDDLIFSLLEYGQLGSMQFPFTAVDLNPLITGILDRQATHIKSRNAQIQIEQPLPVVFGNFELLNQVLDNLIINALKFVPLGTTPHVHISAQKTDNTVRIWIKDNGIGIEPEFQKKIFQIFEQLHDKQKYPGTGIGLALVAKAVQRLKGRVGVESELGKGSRFWVELPLPPA
ncbi:MAG: Integral rane sensor signal transduction histidine kinase [Pedosphaera sp.]|nr:Integral rane sensor signal transduction histidine kinase [Pedosphaera sp.]